MHVAQRIVREQRELVLAADTLQADIDVLGRLVERKSGQAHVIVRRQRAFVLCGHELADELLAASQQHEIQDRSLLVTQAHDPFELAQRGFRQSLERISHEEHLLARHRLVAQIDLDDVTQLRICRVDGRQADIPQDLAEELLARALRRADQTDRNAGGVFESPLDERRLADTGPAAQEETVERPIQDILEPSQRNLAGRGVIPWPHTFRSEWIGLQLVLLEKHQT